VPSPAEGAEAADAFELPPPAKLVSASPVEASAPGLSSPTDMPVPTAVPSPTPMAAEEGRRARAAHSAGDAGAPEDRRARDGVSPQATDVPTISPAITGSLSPHAATPSSAPTVVPGPRTESPPARRGTDAPTLSEMPTRRPPDPSSPAACPRAVTCARGDRGRLQAHPRLRAHGAHRHASVQRAHRGAALAQ
ncbi:unnamed protein product, partial [Prorocentrum cordatum]